MTAPLTVPKEFDRARNLLAHATEHGTFHETRRSCRFACDLVANGTDRDLVLAQEVLAAVLACQVTDPTDVHAGNFLWMAEDDRIEDLNAVVFCLEHLVPMMLGHGDRLPTDTRAGVLDAIRLGLEEVLRLDVWMGYSNITALSVLCCCLGGELLGRTEILDTGRAKLEAWIGFTAESGHVLEFNSPTYAAVSIRALGRLRSLVACPDTAVLADMMLWRLGLSYALHLHRATGRLAGPHGRAYQPSIDGEAPPESQTFAEWLDTGLLPGWLGELYRALPDRREVREGILASEQIAMHTALEPAFAVGSVTRSVHPQGNAVIGHLQGSGDAPGGVLYARHILDDKWLGDFYHATDRSHSRNLMDEGDFLGIQHGTAVLGAYAPHAGRTAFRSARTAFIWTRRVAVTAVYVNDEPAGNLPLTVVPGSRLTVCTDRALCLLQPLHLPDLLQPATVELHRRGGDLVCDIYHYRARETKRFWDLAWPGAFYKGRPACIFFLAVRPRRDLPLADDVRSRWSELSIECTVAPARTRTHLREQRRAAATVSGPDGSFSLDVDLMDFRHRTWPAGGTGLTTPLAAQCDWQDTAEEHSLRVADAEVRASGANILFAREPGSDTWTLVQAADSPGPVSVRVGETTRHVPLTGKGIAMYSAGRLTVRQTQLSAT